jgi:hypothetical protein
LHYDIIKTESVFEKYGSGMFPAAINRLLTFLSGVEAMDFLFWTLIVLAGLCGLTAAGYGLWLLWRYKWSIQVVGANEVAIPLFLGKPSHICRDPATTLCKSGGYFVPYLFGLKWDGHDRWELYKISTEEIPFRFDGSADQRVWSSDHQALLVDVSGYYRSPYEDEDSLKTMQKSGVPTDPEGLQNFMADEIKAGMRKIMAVFDHKQAIDQSNLDAIRKEAVKFFLRKDGLFVKSGMCGKDPHKFDEGTGELIIRVEQVDVMPDLRADMALPVRATYRADAAVQTARQEKIEVSDALKAMVTEQVDEMRKHIPHLTKADIKEIRRECLNQITRDRTMKKGGKLVAAYVSNADGTSFAQGSLSEFVGSIVAAVAAKYAIGSGGDGGGGKGGKRPENMTPDELRDHYKKKK